MPTSTHGSPRKPMRAFSPVEPLNGAYGSSAELSPPSSTTSGILSAMKSSSRLPANRLPLVSIRSISFELSEGAGKRQTSRRSSHCSRSSSLDISGGLDLALAHAEEHSDSKGQANATVAASPASTLLSTARKGNSATRLPNCGQTAGSKGLPELLCANFVTSAVSASAAVLPSSAQAGVTASLSQP